MDFSKKQIAIFYLKKNKGILYVTNCKKPFVVEFRKDIIDNLEIIDKSKFEQLLSSVITKNELKPMNVFIILTHDITLEKELNNTPLSLQSAETEKFLDMVPFHQILTKTYNLNNKTIVVATNKDFCIDIINVFKENLFPAIGIIPLSILEEKFPLIKENFDDKFVLKKIENLNQYFFPLGLERQEKILTYKVPSLKNAQFIALIAIFVLLLIILGIQLYAQISPSVSKSPQTKPAVIKQIIPTPIASPSATITPDDASR